MAMFDDLTKQQQLRLGGGERPGPVASYPEAERQRVLDRDDRTLKSWWPARFQVKCRRLWRDVGGSGDGF